MPKTTAAIAIVLGATLALAACNFPTSQAAPEARSTPQMLSVTTRAEVRAGPGPEYALVGYLEPGQQTQAVGESPNGWYLLILDPDMPVVMGWLRFDPATLVGNPIGLPVATPPPTPPTSGGCPSPVPSGPTPVSCPTYVPPSGSGCPSPVPSGPTPVSCPTYVPPSGSGCPSPVPSGPTPVSCAPTAPPTLPPRMLPTSPPTLPPRRLPNLPPTPIGPTPPS